MGLVWGEEEEVRKKIRKKRRRKARNFLLLKELMVGDFMKLEVLYLI